MRKKLKKKQLLSKKEFIFNFCSLIIIILIGFYYGGRSLYYYSKQNITLKKEANTLNGLILNNNSVVNEGEGLYLDLDGYYFKGKVSNNYVKFGNRLFRIIRVNNDGSIKVITDDLVSTFMWGEDSNYQNSNLKVWLTKTDYQYSGVYYKTIPEIDKFLVKTKYRENVMEKKKVSKVKETYSDYITTLEINDYVLANGQNSYLNIGKVYYLLGLNESKDNLFVDLDGSVQNTDGLNLYGVRAVMTFKKNLEVKSGDGTKNNPFIIEQGKDINYVDSYVLVGNEIYRVYQESNGILRMHKYGYAMNDGKEIIRRYSNSTSLFDFKKKDNISYYLNTSYLDSLSYKDYLLDSNFYTGEIGAETDYDYKNIYNDSVSLKVGLLNIFDYVSSNNFSDYFVMNTISSIGGMQYSKYENGLVEEVEVLEMKHFIPVISVDSSYITSGTGEINNPYTMR